MCEGQIFRLQEIDVSEKFRFRVIRIEDGLLKEFGGSPKGRGDSRQTIKIQFGSKVQLLLDSSHSESYHFDVLSTEERRDLFQFLNGSRLVDG